MNHLPKLIIVADRGRVVADETDENCKTLHIIKELDLAEGHAKISGVVTDKAGAFPDTGSAGHGNSAGERLTLKEELKMRALRKVAHELGQLLGELEPSEWGFAAPSEINGSILVLIGPHWKDSLAANLPVDVVREPSSEVAKRFRKHSQGRN